jgi:hypothetical protein
MYSLVASQETEVGNSHHEYLAMYGSSSLKSTIESGCNKERSRRLNIFEGVATKHAEIICNDMFCLDTISMHLEATGLQVHTIGAGNHGIVRSQVAD